MVVQRRSVTSGFEKKIAGKTAAKLKNLAPLPAKLNFGRLELSTADKDMGVGPSHFVDKLARAPTERRRTCRSDQNLAATHCHPITLTNFLTRGAARRLLVTLRSWDTFLAEVQLITFLLTNDLHGRTRRVPDIALHVGGTSHCEKV